MDSVRNGSAGDTLMLSETLPTMKVRQGQVFEVLQARQIAGHYMRVYFRFFIEVSRLNWAFVVQLSFSLDSSARLQFITIFHLFFITLVSILSTCKVTNGPTKSNSTAYLASETSHQNLQTQYSPCIPYRIHLFFIDSSDLK